MAMDLLQAGVDRSVIAFWLGCWEGRGIMRVVNEAVCSWSTK